MDGIEQRTGSRGNVVRIDIRSEAGREIARRYDVRFTPTFVLFDERGAEVRRTSRADELPERLGDPTGER